MSANLTAADVRMLRSVLQPLINEDPKVDDLSARVVLQKLEPVYRNQIEAIKGRIADLKSLLTSSGSFRVSSITVNDIDVYVPQSTADMGEIATVVRERIEAEVASLTAFLAEGGDASP